MPPGFTIITTIFSARILSDRLTSKRIRRRFITCFRLTSATDFTVTPRGAEIAPEWRPRDFWRLRGSYSFLHMNLGEAPHSQDVATAAPTVGSSPQHQATIQSAFDLTKRLQVDFTYRYVSALPGQSVAAYSTGDARVGWRFSRQLEMSIAGRNLFQPSHYEYGGDPT
jgi:iron complex outermembrane receptor protein